MVDVAEVIERHMHRGALRNTAQYLRQRRHFEECRRADQTQLHLAVLRQIDQADLQSRSLERQFQHRQTETDQHPGQQVSEDDRQRRRRIGEHRHPPITTQTSKRFEIDQFEPGVHQHTRQTRHRNALQHTRQQQHERQQPQTMEDRRVTRGRTSLYVGRTAHDHPGHRQRAEQTAEHVADTLRRQLTVEVRTHAAVHAIHRSGGQQGFGAGDKRHGERGDQQRRVGQAEQVRRFQPINGFGQIRRYFNTFDLQRQQQTGSCRQTHAEQCTGHET
ncbi:hypothetical protein D3C81_1122560 [compost metagenome]